MFTDKSDLLGSGALVETYADCPETGKSRTWALEAWEWKRCQWLQGGGKRSREASLSPVTSDPEAGVAPHFGVESPKQQTQDMGTPGNKIYN